MKNYYEILGVPKDATDDEIKKAFRTLAKEYHPDHNRDDSSAEDKFKEINEAYSVIGDKQKRAEYDSGLSGGFGQSRRTNGQNFDWDGWQTIFSNVWNDIVDTSSTKKNIATDIAMTLEECFSGATKSVTVKRKSPCKYCSGAGSANGERPFDCPDCAGTGKIVHRNNRGGNVFISSTVCSSCGGHGKVIRARCAKCAGTGIVESNDKISFKIPAGVGDGTRIKVAGEGHIDKDGSRGDLYVTVSEKKHSRFRRVGADIYINTSVTYPELVLGTSMEVESIDGKHRFDVAPGSSSGQQIRISGRGMPKINGGRGDLIVIVNLDIPRRISSREREILIELRKRA